MPRIYLDTCAIQRPLGGREQARVRAETDAATTILAAISANAVALVTSAVLRVETEQGTDPARRQFARRVLALATHDVASSDALVRKAQALEALGVRPMDALHLASAIASGADFFCTTDDRFLRKARIANTEPTRVVTPLELATALNL